VHVDGDDELLGRNVLKVLNVIYQREKVGFLYSLSYVIYAQGKKMISIGRWPS